MYGFQSMHSSVSEANELIEKFAELYERSDVHFLSAYDASTVLYSMQGGNYACTFWLHIQSCICIYVYTRIYIG